MKPLLLFICIFLSCAPILVSAQQNLTLQECINIALENNRNIKQQKLTKEQRQIAFSQARADLLPNLNASAGQNFIFGRSIGLDNTYQNTNSSQTNFSINSNITLFDGLRMKYNIDARKADMNASDADMLKLQEDIILSVSTAFLQVLLYQELLQIASDQLELTNVNLKQRNALVESGKLAEGELYELEAQLAREDLERVRAVSNLKLALLDLAQIMELEDFSNLSVTAPETDELIAEGAIINSNEVYESAIVLRPEVRGAQYRLESSQKEVLMAKSQLYPSLSFGANMGTGYYNMSGVSNGSFKSQLKNNMSNSLGFNLQIPIFNRFQVKNNIRNAQLMVENNKIEIDKVKIDLRKRSEQAYYNAVGAQSRWQAAIKSETAGREAYRFAEQKFENGRANAYELFQAKTNLTQVLGEQAQAKYEYAFRLKILELLKD